MVVVVVAVGEVVLPGRVRQESVCGAGSPLAAGKPNHPGEAPASMGSRDLGAGTGLIFTAVRSTPIHCMLPSQISTAIVILPLPHIELCGKEKGGV